MNARAQTCEAGWAFNGMYAGVQVFGVGACVSLCGDEALVLGYVKMRVRTCAWRSLCEVHFVHGLGLCLLFLAPLLQVTKSTDFKTSTDSLGGHNNVTLPSHCRAS